MFKLFSKYVDMSCFLVYHRDATRYALISFCFRLPFYRTCPVYVFIKKHAAICIVPDAKVINILI